MCLLVATQPAEGRREPAHAEEAGSCRLRVGELDSAAEIRLSLAVAAREAEGVSQRDRRLGVGLATVLRGE